ncbi:MAG: hypothetical protein HC847_01310 [Hydrococcus sp. RU_2_2]|nr:hypothetical protein [Hydrococcus sp. RU_2_2]NJP21381.1 hypothetical protein [Hydrococcus sp. CRU_1_1]
MQAIRQVLLYLRSPVIARKIYFFNFMRLVNCCRDRPVGSDQTDRPQQNIF